MLRKCKFAKENRVIIGINFSDILNSSGVERANILGRIMQNIRLCRKYKVDMLTASFATDPFEMRSAKDLLSFNISLGMEPGVSKRALTIASSLSKK